METKKVNEFSSNQLYAWKICNKSVKNSVKKICEQQCQQQQKIVQQNFIVNEKFTFCKSQRLNDQKYSKQYYWKISENKMLKQQHPRRRKFFYGKQCVKRSHQGQFKLRMLTKMPFFQDNSIYRDNLNTVKIPTIMLKSSSLQTTMWSI